MIQATFCKDKSGHYQSFSCNGHAGYATTGQDVICAAVSALVLTIINSIELLTDDTFEIRNDQKKKGFIEFTLIKEASKETTLLLDTLALGLTQTQDTYGKQYVTVTFKEV